METARWKGGLDDPAAQEATMQREGPSTPPRPAARDREGQWTKRTQKNIFQKVLECFRLNPNWKQDEDVDFRQTGSPDKPLGAPTL